MEIDVDSKWRLNKISFSLFVLQNRVEKTIKKLDHQILKIRPSHPRRVPTGWSKMLLTTNNFFNDFDNTFVG